MSIGMFFGSFKKGSKYCRNVLLKKNIHMVEITRGENILKFFDLISLPIPDKQEVENVSAFWSITTLPNKFREFLFKFFNNRLGLNVRTVHFGGETRFCTFCLLENSPLMDESFDHLFYSCHTVKLIHERIESSVLGIAESDKKRWFGFPTGDTGNNFYCLFFLSVQFFIWRSKLNNTLPNSNFILGESIQLLDNLSKFNSKIFSGKDNYDCILSRNWDRLRARRW